MNKIPIYNKAIRDNIPQIILKSGSKCHYKILSDEDFLPHLEQKLHEELEEYDVSKSLMELVDIIEIIYRIAEISNVSKEELEKMRIDKREKRGGFNKNLFLINTL